VTAARVIRFLAKAAIAATAALLLMPALGRAGDIPPVPTRYFNDYAHVVNNATAQRFNIHLTNFERQTSNQLLVVVYPKLDTDDALDDYCYRTFQAWGVGQKKLNNGAVLFVFVADHKMRIQTGYGLEGALPDITCARILDEQIAPAFKRGDYAGGLRAGINAIIAATQGEYHGTGQTVSDHRFALPGNLADLMFVAGLILFSIGMSTIRGTQGVIYGSNGMWRYGGFSSGGGGGGFSGGGGGFGGGGGGGFSGGGGSSGGGGASGSW
jgi:uncharacterized protein